MSLSRVGLSHLLLYLPSGTTQEPSRFLCLSWHSGAQTRAAALQERCCLPGSAPPGAGTEFTGSPDSPSLSRPGTEAGCRRPNLPVYFSSPSEHPLCLRATQEVVCKTQPDGEVVLWEGEGGRAQAKKHQHRKQQTQRKAAL